MPMSLDGVGDVLHMILLTYRVYCRSVIAKELNGPKEVVASKGVTGAKQNL